MNSLMAMMIWLLIGCDTAPVPDVTTKVDSRGLHSNTKVVRFSGICDGSAVVRLPNSNLLFAYDELNSLFEFAPTGGAALREYDYGSALDVKSEVDVEAAVLVGEYIWWIGSHGNDGDGNRALSRQHLFRTPVVGEDYTEADAEETNGVVTRLQIDVLDSINLLALLYKQGSAAGLLNDDQLHLKPKKGGINIEGLSVMDNGDLLLGLRSPLSAAADALVVQIELGSKAPRVVRFYKLDLDGRGIRDLKASNDAYLLIAGNVDNGGEYSIYRWMPGAASDRLFDLPAHFNAEALVDLGQSWLVLSDDGKVKRSDESAADGSRSCDTIRRKNPLAERHPSVFFRALVLDHQTLQ